MRGCGPSTCTGMIPIEANWRQWETHSSRLTNRVLVTNHVFAYKMLGVPIGGIHLIQWHQRHVWTSRLSVVTFLIVWLSTQTNGTLYRTESRGLHVDSPRVVSGPFYQAPLCLPSTTVKTIHSRLPRCRATSDLISPFVFVLIWMCVVTL